MSEPFMAEIKLVSFDFPPKGWAFCDGQLLPINQNQALFSLLGTMYGGNGQTNFALPDLRGRTPIHVGSGHTLGQRGGSEAHTLTVSELPTHVHEARASAADAASLSPGEMLPATTITPLYADAVDLVPMSPGASTSAGGSQAHLNMQPFLALRFAIALQGIFPSPN